VFEPHPLGIAGSSQTGLQFVTNRAADGQIDQSFRERWVMDCRQNLRACSAFLATWRAVSAVGQVAGAVS
jgi:hypothetical protein